MILTEKNRSSQIKTCPSAALPSTNPTRASPGANPGLQIGKPATNRLNNDTAVICNTNYPTSHISICDNWFITFLKRSLLRQ
jgi:hypothetical protein